MRNVYVDEFELRSGYGAMDAPRFLNNAKDFTAENKIIFAAIPAITGVIAAVVFSFRLGGMVLIFPGMGMLLTGTVYKVFMKGLRKYQLKHDLIMVNGLLMLNGGILISLFPLYSKIIASVTALFIGIVLMILPLMERKARKARCTQMVNATCIFHKTGRNGSFLNMGGMRAAVWFFAMKGEEYTYIDTEYKTIQTTKEGDIETLFVDPEDTQIVYRESDLSYRKYIFRGAVLVILTDLYLMGIL